MSLYTIPLSASGKSQQASGAGAFAHGGCKGIDCLTGGEGKLGGIQAGWDAAGGRRRRRWEASRKEMDNYVMMEGLSDSDKSPSGGFSSVSVMLQQCNASILFALTYLSRGKQHLPRSVCGVDFRQVVDPAQEALPDDSRIWGEGGMMEEGGGATLTRVQCAAMPCHASLEEKLN